MVQMLGDSMACIETDTVEGFLVEGINSNKLNPNLTITSGFDPLLKRWVPLLISILFGKSTEDYKVRWEKVFQVFSSLLGRTSS